MIFLYFFQEILSYYPNGDEKAIMEFFTTEEIPEAWLKIFITLVPKRPNAIELGHYKLTSLCTTLYKIYAKLMVERLKPILPCVICSE